MRMRRPWLLASTLLRPPARLTASSLSRRSVVCSTALKHGWSKTPSVCYGSPVCAFGAPQASGFGSWEQDAPHHPGTRRPVRAALPVRIRVTAWILDLLPYPRTIAQEVGSKEARFSSGRHPSAGTLGSSTRHTDGGTTKTFGESTAENEGTTAICKAVARPWSAVRFQCFSINFSETNLISLNNAMYGTTQKRDET